MKLWNSVFFHLLDLLCQVRAGMGTARRPSRETADGTVESERCQREMDSATIGSLPPAHPRPQCPGTHGSPHQTCSLCLRSQRRRLQIFHQKILIDFVLHWDLLC